MPSEETLRKWAGPSSNTEKEKQDRTERMIRDAISEYPTLSECRLNVFAKGSYANNTNVRANSDVDIAIECTEVSYWDEAVAGSHIPGKIYEGIWTPKTLRDELQDALRAKFNDGVDLSGSTAIRVNSGTSRIDADIVPCFRYRYYYSSGHSRMGTKVFTKTGKSTVNYPLQQLENGRNKNIRTNYNYKKIVRILKRVGNILESNGIPDPPASYFIECLVYNCPDDLFLQSTYRDTLKGILIYFWNSLQNQETIEEQSRWREVNHYKFLFHPNQGWTKGQALAFANTAWDYLGLS